MVICGLSWIKLQVNRELDADGQDAVPDPAKGKAILMVSADAKTKKQNYVKQKPSAKAGAPKKKQLKKGKA